MEWSATKSVDRNPWPRRAPAVVLAALLTVPGLAGADSCPEEPGIAGMAPSDGEAGLPTNTIVRVRYPRAGAPADDEMRGWIEVRSGGLIVPGEVTWDRVEASWMPLQELSPRSSYEVSIARRDLEPLPIAFATGDGQDVEAPGVGRRPALAWDWLASGNPDDPCGPTLGRVYHFEVEPRAGQDDSGAAQLEHIVFQSSHPSLSDAVEVARVYSPPRAELYFGEGTAAEGKTVCFATMARDHAGHLSAITAAQCVDVEPGPFFRSCTVAADPRPRFATEVWLLVAATAVLIGRRSWRTRQT